MKTRVLHLTSTRYGIGGVEKLLLDMSDKYDFSRFEIAYCNLFCDKNGEGVFPTALKQRNLRYFQIDGNRWYHIPKMLFNLISLLRREKFQIVHLHMLKATILGGLAARFAGKTKTILTKHYTDELSKHNKIVNILDNFFTKNADNVAAISDYVKNDLIKLSVPESKITVILNGTDLKAFDKLSECYFPLPDSELGGKFLIGTVGSLTARKGHRYLLQALQIVLRKHPNLHLIIAGEGPEREKLENLIEEMKIKNNVTMLGFKENIAPLLRKIDVYIHPSVNEPFGIAILEAMAAGKCVIASSVEGVPEIITEGENGLLVPATDVESLAQAISTALDNLSQTKRMGQSGRKKVEDTFSIEKTVENYQNLYSRTC